jgi:hypothetical protein
MTERTWITPHTAELERLEHPYSGGIRYQLWVTPPSEAEALPLIDGGSFDWLTKLAHNRRLVFIGSGAGSQLMPLRFRVNSP